MRPCSTCLTKICEKHIIYIEQGIVRVENDVRVYLHILCKSIVVVVIVVASGDVATQKWWHAIPRRTFQLLCESHSIVGAFISAFSLCIFESNWKFKNTQA